MVQMILEEQIVDATTLAQRVEIDLCQVVAPLLVELFEARAPHWWERVRVSANQAAAIGIVILNHVAHFGHGLIERWRRSDVNLAGGSRRNGQ